MAEVSKDGSDDLFDGMETDEKEPIVEQVNGPSPDDLDILEDELFGDDALDKQEEEEEKQIQLAALEILNASNVQELTLRQIREQLAEKYQINTDKHKKLIRTIVETYLSEHQNLEEDLERKDDDEVQATLGQRNTEVTGKKKRPSVFSKPALLSAALSDFMGGQKFAPRGEVVKAIWDYIKLHQLQNPKDRRFILFDEKLQTIFKKKSSHFMKMSGLLAKEMKSVEHVQQSSLQDDDDDEDEEEEEEEEEVEEKKPSRRNSSSNNGKSNQNSNSRKRSGSSEPSSQSKRRKTNNSQSKRKAVNHSSEGEEEDNNSKAEDDDEEEEEEEEEEKKPSKTSSSSRKSTKPTKLLIPEFAEFFHIDPTTPRKLVVKVLYQYIKDKDLPNPKNRREILLDEPLQQFFKVKKVTYFSINKYLNKVFYDE